MYLDLKENFKEACLAIKKKTNALKNSLLPGGAFTLLWFDTTFLSHLAVNYIYHDSGSKLTLLLSNVPGYQKPVYYGGKPAKKFFSLVSGAGNCATGISVVSMVKSAMISITSDVSNIEDLPLFTSYFDNLIKELDIEYFSDEE
jgi:hypothetical protein